MVERTGLQENEYWDFSGTEQSLFSLVVLLGVLDILCESVVFAFCHV